MNLGFSKCVRLVSLVCKDPIHDVLFWTHGEMCLSLIYFIFIREPEKYKLLLRSGRVLCCWWAASVPAQQTLYYGSSTESFSNTTCCVSPLLTPSIPLGSVEIPMLAVKGVQSPASFTRFFASFLVKGSIRCNNLSFTIDRAL